VLAFVHPFRTLACLVLALLMLASWRNRAGPFRYLPR
jgi:hypothetical protein